MKTLIDSGNLCSDLISESLAKLLNLKIDSKEAKVVGTANSKSKVEILGRCKPIVLYLEGLKYPVVIKPMVVRDLAHPINLGNHFLRRNNAHIEFGSDFVRLGLNKSRSQVIPLQPSNFNILAPSIDHKFKLALDLYKYGGNNPRITNNTNVLDLRHLRILPGLHTVQDTSENMSETSTTTQQFAETNENFTVYSITNTVLEPSTAVAIPVILVNHVNTSTNPTVNSVMFQPFKTSDLVIKSVLVHPGVYRVGHVKQDISQEIAKAKSKYKTSNVSTGYLTAANYNSRHIEIPKYLALGVASELVSVKNESINVLSHKPQHHLSDREYAEREQFIRDSLELHKNELLRDHPAMIKKIVNLFLEHFDCVSIAEDDFGKTDLLQFHIQLEKGAVPVRMKPRPLNPIQEKSLRKQLDVWLAAQVIEPSISPWGAALVPVRKKNSDELRWALDFRQLNNVTVQDAYPLARIDVTLQKLSGAKIFSVIDSAGAFHSIPVEKSSRPLTAFLSPFGQFHFCRVPFGVKNGPSAYSRLIDMALSHLPRTFSLAYIDDVILYSKSLNDHLQHLTEIIKVHAKAGMKIKLKKTKLFQQEVEYLGHLVSKEGIKMVPEYVDRILSWPRPQTGKELKSFLGFCGYYRGFIPEYSKLSCDLESMKMQDKPVWSDKSIKDFESLKIAFTKAPTRGFPDYESDQPFILDTDFSKEACSAVLSQVQSGQERFLACFAKKNSPAERNYPSMKGELLAIILALRKFEHILRAKKFLIRTDNSPLKYLHNTKKTEGLFAKWHAYLATFKYDLEHRSGKLQVNADVLSRRRDFVEEYEDPKDKLQPYEHFHDVEDSIYSIKRPRPIKHMLNKTCENVKELFYSLMLPKQSKMYDSQGGLDISCEINNPNNDKRELVSEDGNVTISQSKAYCNVNNLYCKEQDDDPTIKIVKSWIKSGIFPQQEERKTLSQDVRTYYDMRQMLRICPATKLLYVFLPSDSKRICLPTSLRGEIFERFHEKLSHPGLNETYRKIIKHFYYPNIYPYLSLRIANCKDCLSKYPSEFSDRKDVKSTYTEMTTHFNQRLYIDCVGPLVCTRFNGQHVQYLVTILDGFSRYLVAIPVCDITAQTVSQALIDKWILVHGCPMTLHSDRGSAFVSEVYRNVLKSFNIKQSFTPAYNPQSNRVERAHQTLMRLVRADKSLPLERWPEKVHFAVFLYNCSTNAITGLSPYEIVYGRMPNLPMTYVIPKIPSTRYKDFISLIDCREAMLQEMTDKVILKQSQYGLMLQQNVNPQKYTLKLGDTVYYLLPTLTKKGEKKLKSSWCGPFVVDTILSDMVVKLKYQNPTTERMRNRVICANISRVRKISSVDEKKTHYFENEEESSGDVEDRLNEQLENSLDDPLATAAIVKGIDFEPTTLKEVNGKNNDMRVRDEILPESDSE